MNHAYSDADAELIESWHRIHANAEQTHVHLSRIAEDRYVVVATDVDPVDFQAGESETIAFDATATGARKKAEAWLEQHPKGVAESDGDSLTAKAKDALMSLDQSEQAEGQ